MESEKHHFEEKLVALENFIDVDLFAPLESNISFSVDFVYTRTGSNLPFNSLKEKVYVLLYFQCIRCDYNSTNIPNTNNEHKK